MILVHVSGHLKDYTGKKREVQVSDKVDTVLGLLADLDLKFPGVKHRILDDQEKTREFVNIFVNGENIRDGEAELTKLKDGDRVHILPSVAGG
jgi:molybdopterin synthase sulfur carrier subunit